MTHIRVSHVVAIGAMAFAALILLCNDAKGQPVIFDVATDRGNDTLYVGEPSVISCAVDPQGRPMYGMTLPLEIGFSNGNIIGASPGTAFVNVIQVGTFVPLAVVPWDQLSGNDPDTLLVAFISSDTPDPLSPMDVVRIGFQPQDTGLILVDTTLIPPANVLAAFDSLGLHAVEWNSDPITVLPCPNVLGDVNQDGVVTSSDIIVLVQCVFKCGPGFFDVLDLGNVDCGLSTTAADVIRIVNFVFRDVDLPFCCIVLD
jgi:hypothetical protein